MALFKLEDVKFESRAKELIHGISMEIEKGCVVSLAGKSGSGKSTLLKLIAGLLVPSGGHVYFDGRDIQHMTKAENLDFRRRASYVFQDSALWENQTVLQNLELPLLTHQKNLSPDERMTLIEDVCHKVNYTRPLNLRPADLSRGEQKLVAFARAIINRPEVLFLDDCTESLDRKRMVNIMDLLSEFVQKKNTIVYITHDSSFITAFPGTVYFLEEGLITE
ncbi:MAG: ATP-binding cassette domain-containing protein [Treponema sp.]|nr:ATP-binding cassette domain-containing protein [Treponema sp.]